MKGIEKTIQMMKQDGMMSNRSSRFSERAPFTTNLANIVDQV